MNRIFIIFLIGIFTSLACSSDDSIPDDLTQELYFPPLSSNAWGNTDISSLGWNESELQELYNYLDEKHTKGFIILKGGKIVVEQYFNNHSQNKKWPWYSAAKSLTSVGIGIAQDENILNIDNKMSDYLGSNWSYLSQDKQDLITVKHHLMMNSGLKSDINNFVEWSCTLPKCLTYYSDAGNTWAYHQGAFVLLQDLISKNSGMNFKTYFKTKILDKTGMIGTWNKVLFLNIFSSDTRSMARFGLLMLNKGVWNENVIVSEDYFNEMTNTSQDLNKAYGYLWWLNGKDSFVGTNSQAYQESLVSNAPSDMIAALGAQDQKIYVIPSKNMVIVRCGESAGNTAFANSSFDNELWSKINAVIK